MGGINSNQSALIPSAPAAAVVGLTSALILPANLNRTGLVLINTSANWISFGLGYPAVLYSGISIAPNGGVWELDDWTGFTGSIFAIASGVNSALALQEYS